MQRKEEMVDCFIYICTVNEGNLVKDIFDTFIHCLRIEGDIGGKGEDGVPNFRNQINDNPDGTADDNAVKQQNTEDTGQLFMLFAKFAQIAEKPLKPFHKRIGDISNGKANQKWRNQAFNIEENDRKAIADIRQIADNLFEKNQCRRNQKDIHTDFQEEPVLTIFIFVKKIKLSHI